MRPSEIRKAKESFLRALVLSIMMAILTNALSFFWAIGGEAWFEDSYLYLTSSPHDSDEKRYQSRIDVSVSEIREPAPSFIKDSDFQKKESEENGDFQFIENIFQYIIQSIKELFQSIIEYFS